MQTVAASHPWRSSTNADTIVFSWQTHGCSCLKPLFVCSLQPYFTWRHLNAIFKKDSKRKVMLIPLKVIYLFEQRVHSQAQAEWGTLTRGGFQSACWGSKVHPRSTAAFSPLFLLDTPDSSQQLSYCTTRPDWWTRWQENKKKAAFSFCSVSFMSYL